MAVPRLDDWLPDPAVRTHHRRSSLVDADELWRAALEVRLSDTAALGRLIRWRIPGTPPGQPFGELFRDYPFTVLEEDERVLISGLCGRIWTLTRDYPHLPDAEAFRDWGEPGTVRVLFAHWVEPLGRVRGGARLGGTRGCGRPRSGTAPARPLDGGGPVRAARELGGARRGRQASGEPSSRPARGERASMIVRRPRLTRSAIPPASSC